MPKARILKKMPYSKSITVDDESAFEELKDYYVGDVAHTKNYDKLWQVNPAGAWQELPTDIAAGGANVVTGSFTFHSSVTESHFDIPLEYNGNGYPVAILVFVNDGVFNTNGAFYKKAWRDVIGAVAVLKSYPSRYPTYSNMRADENVGSLIGIKKSSMSTSSTATEAYKVDKVAIFSNDDSSSNASPVVIKSPQKINVSIAGDSAVRGFISDVEYRYVVVYSE